MSQLRTLFLLAITFFSSSANANQHITVKIGNLKDARQGSVVELPVYLTNSHYDIQSIDFLLTFDTKVFFLQSVIPAKTTDNGISYWDRFDVYDCTKKDKDSSCPRGTIRISAIVKGNNQRIPNCLNDAKELEIFRIKFMITNDRTFEGRTYPVHFVWNECLDNTISVDLSEKGRGNETLCADSVLFENSRLVGQIELPATAYFPDSCLFNKNRSQKRVIDFHHGYINLCCYHMEDFSGDVNLNGLSNEVADFLLFQDYFLYGFSIFTTNPAGQIANTDVNFDGQPVTLEDLVYFDAIIRGESKPLRKTRPMANGTISVDNSASRIFFKSDSMAYAIWLQFRGSITPISKRDAELFRYNYADSVTNVLIFGLDSTATGEIELIRYMPALRLIDAQAATRDGTQIDLVIDK